MTLYVGHRQLSSDDKLTVFEAEFQQKRSSSILQLDKFIGQKHEIAHDDVIGTKLSFVGYSNTTFPSHMPNNLTACFGVKALSSPAEKKSIC